VELGDGGDGVARQQQGTEQRLLGGEIVWRDSARSSLLALSSLVRHGPQPFFLTPGDR
jgi:hypothetical protein